MLRILTTLVLISFSYLHSANFYVSESGSDHNQGTYKSPFLSIQKAANIVNPGDTVFVMDGVYTDRERDGFIVNLHRGGTPQQWIVFRSLNKHGAVLDGRSNTTGYTD